MIALEVMLKERKWCAFEKNGLEMYVFVSKLNKCLPCR